MMSRKVSPNLKILNLHYHNINVMGGFSRHYQYQTGGPFALAGLARTPAACCCPASGL
jgi:hypothetical protein